MPRESFSFFPFFALKFNPPPSGDVSRIPD
jgi:hypothetical protein